MKVHRFITKQIISITTTILNDKELVYQINKVLRLNPGEQISLSNGHGEALIFEIDKINHDNITIKFLNKSTELKSDKEIILYCAILKKENFELVVQKATEIGVTKIVPLISERTIKLGLNFERLHKIAKEAAEQSGHNSLPEITEIINLETALINAQIQDLVLFFDITGRKLTNLIFENKKSIGIFIGPEGGWSQKELALILNQTHSFMAAKLGDFTLRAETAAIVSLGLINNFIN